ncbi:MAG: alpha/beta hydrolase [Bacteroidales bacterium]
MMRFYRIAALIVITLICNLGIAESKKVKVSDGTEIYITVKGKGPYCLYLHGGPGSGSYWLEKYYGDVLEKYFTMVYLDQRGVGRSSSPQNNDFSMSRMASDFEEVRKELKVEKWYTLGHSFGGVLQMGYYERYPSSMSGMLMINCTLSLEDSFKNSWIPKAYELSGVEYDQKSDTLKLMDRFLDALKAISEKGDRWRMAFLNKASEDSISTTYSEINNWNNTFSNVAFSINDYWKDYTTATSDVKVPVLFFYGKSDWSIGPKHYTKVKFPISKVVSCETAHFPFLENKKELEESISQFLQ